MLVTRNSSISAPSLCSAFAIADSIAFLISPAAFFCVNDKMFSALSTGLPRTRSATSLPFCADRRTPRTDAVVSIVHGDCQADELRQDRRATRPRLNRFLIARRCGRFHLGHQVAIYKRALF